MPMSSRISLRAEPWFGRLFDVVAIALDGVCAVFFVVGSRCRIAFDALLVQALQASMIELSRRTRSLSAYDERNDCSYFARPVQFEAYR